MGKQPRITVKKALGTATAVRSLTRVEKESLQSPSQSSPPTQTCKVVFLSQDYHFSHDNDKTNRIAVRLMNQLGETNKEVRRLCGEKAQLEYQLHDSLEENKRLRHIVKEIKQQLYTQHRNR
ncbi:hypothetical protein PS15p_206657 [Mucor circinelloides]